LRWINVLAGQFLKLVKNWECAMHRRATVMVSCALALLSAQALRAEEIIKGMTRDEVATILKDSGYRAEIIPEASSSTGATIRTGMGGHTVIVVFFNCAAEKCAAIQFWTGYRKSPKVTADLVKKWNTEIRYAKTHLTDDGGMHVEYDVYLAGGVSSEYIKSAAVLYGNLLSRLDDYVKAAPAVAETETVGKGSNIDALAAEGKYSEAIAALDETAAGLWDKAPLTFRRALWVAAQPEGFGAYNPRENSIFASGVKMLAYAEPVGFGWRKNGDVFETDMAVDIVVKGKDGAVLLRKEDFQGLRIGSRVKNREFMAHIGYTFTGIPVGEYVVETTMRDKVSGKTGAFALPFTVR
jgi:Putative bacterial sensory transduction regulator